MKDMKLKVIAGIIAFALVGSIACVLTSCNKQIIDTNYTFDKAIINTGKDVIEVDIKSWKDFEDGDQIQVKTDDGTVYLVHSSNITLICSED